MAVASITDLGSIVKRRREEFGWSIREAGARAGTSRYFVADLEKGKPSCQFDKILATLDALQLKVELRAPAPKLRPLAIASGDLENRRPLRQGPAMPVEHTHDDPETVGCLECGQRVRNLQRHLASAHSMRTIEYRRRWRLDDEFDLRPRAVAAATEQRRRVRDVMKRGVEA